MSRQFWRFRLDILIMFGVSIAGVENMCGNVHVRLTSDGNSALHAAFEST